MSALVMGLVWELPETPDFGRAEKFVLMAYADHADSNGKSIYPSIDLICKKTFYEERSVQKITRSLETMGFLADDGVGPHGTNRWAIPLERTANGGAKIAPLPKIAGAENAPEENAPEGNAPEGNAPEPSVVEVKRDDRFGKNANLLATLTGGALNTSSANLLDTWLEKHSDEWIAKAVEIAKDKGAKSEKYVDSILIGWEANGYPKSREEKIQGAKNVNTSTGNPKRKDAPTDPKPVYTDADRAAAERVRERKRARLPAVS